jgi:cytochrome bd ubiquinol oxidase subunit II
VGTVWYVILAGLLIGYAILDGFDLGVGALHLLVARTDAERRAALAAIGPVWDGNEVWLITWGASLFLAFPRVYAVGFSGFYLAFMLVLWLLLGRGIAIEFRHHVADPLWRGFWDVNFAISSLLLALLYGVAVGNVVGGVPLDARGYFQGLFEWMLNPYALLLGAFSVVVLALHGANYLVLKTSGGVQRRARSAAGFLGYLTTGLVLVLTLATLIAHPAIARNFRAAPTLLLVPLLALVVLILPWFFRRRAWDGGSFVCSAALIFALLAATAIGLYPNLLVSSPNPERSLTVDNAAAAPTSLVAALLWIVPGLALLGVYEEVVYRIFKGKVGVETGAHY